MAGEVYRVFPDYSADPVWADDGMVDLDTLDITQYLRDELRAWGLEWERLVGVRQARFRIVERDSHQRWIADGQRLADRLQKELGPDVVVDYRP